VPRIVAAAIFNVLIAAGCSQPPPPKLPPPVVHVATLQTRPIEQVREWLATLDGADNADIRPHVVGYVRSVNYHEGGVVKAGTLLFTIDDRPFVAAVEKARGDLENAQAQLGKSRADVARFTPLVAENAIPRQQLDDAQSALRAAEANVTAMRGNLRTAELNVEWARVRAPIDGVAGIARVRVGNLVDSNQVLTTVSTLNPIRASFNISQQEYLQYAEVFNHVNAPENEKTRLLELVLIDDRVHPHASRRLIVNREIDSQTGTLQLQALFPNPDNVLRPGLFGKVRLHTTTPTPTVVVPEIAVQQLQGQARVAVVDEAGRADVRAVKLGRLVGHEYLVEDGLRAGERVIVEGQQNVQPGMPVRAQPWTAPTVAAGAGTRANGGS
jgi:membrane fusion protein, multidrug efflux system